MAIDLRKELKKILGKRWDTVVLRLRTDIKCFCWRDSNTPDLECPNCEGLGYVFNEHLVKCKVFFSQSYSVSHAQDFDYGISYNNTYIGYFDVNSITDSIRINDEIYEIEVHENGVPKSPIIRKRRWIINDVYKMNLDNGKREFIKVYFKPKTL